MKIQVLSDLHLEHVGFVPEHHPAADVIVLAGDLAPYTEGLVDQLAEHWSGAPHILYVLGNHEVYGTEIDETRARLAEECAGAGIHLLDPGMVQIEGNRFIGATLWTDLLLAHHAPSPRSIRDWYEGDPFNPAFASDLDGVIERYQPALWIHGHMHDPVDERLGKTRLIENPAGYAYEEKDGFDPSLCVDRQWSHDFNTAMRFAVVESASRRQGGSVPNKSVEERLPRPRPHYLRCAKCSL